MAPTQEEKKQFYENVQTLGEALLAAMPHLGCDACKAPKEVKRCRCDCHVDYYPGEVEP